MLLHDFLRLPFRATILRSYLGVSPQTFQHLLTDEPVQPAIIGRMMRKLKVPDAQIQASLSQLTLPQTKVRPPAIAPVTLPHLATPRDPAPLIPPPQAVLSSTRGPSDTLIIVVSPVSTSQARRVNHSLYAGNWTDYEMYPRQQLSTAKLAAFSRSWHYHLPANQVYIFHNYRDHLAAQARFELYLLVLLKLISQAKAPLNIVIDQQCGDNMLKAFGAELERLQHFLNISQLQPLTTIFADAADNLNLQAANVVALATARLPKSEWHHALIDPINGDVLMTEPLVKAFRHRHS